MDITTKVNSVVLKELKLILSFIKKNSIFDVKEPQISRIRKDNGKLEYSIPETIRNNFRYSNIGVASAAQGIKNLKEIQILLLLQRMLSNISVFSIRGELSKLIHFLEIMESDRNYQFFDDERNETGGKTLINFLFSKIHEEANVKESIFQWHIYLNMLRNAYINKLDTVISTRSNKLKYEIGSSNFNEFRNHLTIKKKFVNDKSITDFDIFIEEAKILNYIFDKSIPNILNKLAIDKTKLLKLVKSKDLFEKSKDKPTDEEILRAVRFYQDNREQSISELITSNKKIINELLNEDKNGDQFNDASGDGEPPSGIYGSAIKEIEDEIKRGYKERRKEAGLFETNGSFSSGTFTNENDNNAIKNRGFIDTGRDDFAKKYHNVSDGVSTKDYPGPPVYSDKRTMDKWAKVFNQKIPNKNPEW